MQPRPTLPDTKNVPTIYIDLDDNRFCADPKCRKVINEGAAIRRGVVRIRCRHCKQLNVITESNHYVVQE